MAALLLLGALAACGGGGGGGRQPVSSTAGMPPNYAPPGPPSDPWGPYISQAAHRFDVPQPWIRTVIRQESGGHQYMRGQPVTSDAGAMGLMQLMPATYGELAARFGLGPDPYDPHDNIMAGTGYIRDLYGQFGSPAFLAAYNAGPHRLQAYLAGHGSLPNETVNYLASAAPGLGNERPTSGPLATFADAGRLPAPAPLHDYVRAPGAQCWQDPDAAYDPTAPCRSAPPVRVAAAIPAVRTAARTVLATRGPCWQDPNAAYDPDAPCRAAPPVQVAAAIPAARYAAVASPAPWSPPPAPVQAALRAAPAYRGPCWQDPNAAYDPAAPCRRAPAARAIAQAPAPYRFPGNLQIARAQVASAQGAPIRRAMATGRWAIQVGAFATPAQARRTAESVRSLAPAQLGGAQAVLGTTAPFGGQVMYRARLLGLSAENASAACRDLRAQSQACTPIAPGG